MQARTRGASKAATTAPRRRRASSIRRRARVRPPPRARHMTAWWPSLPTRGAARGAPPRTRTSLRTRTRTGARTRTRARTRRYTSGGGSYVRLNTALGAGQPDCTLLCALAAPTGALHFRLAQAALRLFIPLGSPPRPSTAAPNSGAPGPSLHLTVLRSMTQAFPSPASSPACLDTCS